MTLTTPTKDKSLKDAMETLKERGNDVLKGALKEINQIKNQYNADLEKALIKIDQMRYWDFNEILNDLEKIDEIRNQDLKDYAKLVKRITQECTDIELRGVMLRLVESTERQNSKEKINLDRLYTCAFIP